jgi:hypothetical protein
MEVIRMRRREFIGSIGAVSMFPSAVWSQQLSSGVSASVPAGTIPLSYDDARFSGNAASNTVTIAAGRTLSNKSITETGSIASILMTGDSGVIQTCRVNSEECVRIGGSGSFLIDNCYLEALGAGLDHADVIQTYSPGSRGTLRVSNTAIVTHSVAANVGLFVADDWTGTVDLENVAFIGGGVNFGLRVHPDTGGDNIIKLKNVFFVPPFKYGPYLFGDHGGRKNVIQLWDNVRNATIVNGALVPGSVFRKPF